MSNTVWTRSKARAESAAQAHRDDSRSSKNALEVRSADDPVPKFVETGLPTKRRRGNEEDARKHRTRRQPLGNRNAPEVHPAEHPLPKVLDMGYTTKRRSRKEEDVRKHKTRSQPVDNRIHADCSKNALEVHPAEDHPLQQVLEMGFTRKRRRRKEEDSQKHRTRSQPVGNRIHADTPKIQRRTACRGEQIDLELKVLGKRKKKMRGSLSNKKPVKRGRGDEDITQSITVSEGLSRDEIYEHVEGRSTIGTPLEGAEEQRYSRPMTAKMRWKDRARGLINENIGPTTLIADQTPYEQQDIAHPSCQVPPSANESLPCEKLKAARFLEKRGHQSGNVGNGEQIQNRIKLRIARQLASKTKRQQRACKKRIGILKKLISWANQTKILKNTVEHDGDSTGATELKLVMTENDRENFVQKMVEKCRNNRDLGSSFLGSVKMLVNSGLMHSAASTLLKEASCEEAQGVVKAWENFKLQQPAGKGLPMDLLDAVAELHEKRKDLAGELARFEGPESCSLRQIHESTWQIQIRNCGWMEKSSLS